MTSPSRIARLEEAAEGSRELDEEIHVSLRLPGEVLWQMANYTMDIHPYVKEPSSDHVGGFSKNPLPRYTTSLDAALALAERMLPGWHCHIGNLPASDDADHEPHHKFAALLYDPKPYVRNRQDFMEHGATRPLALCAAILKATTNRTDEGAENG